LFCGTRTVPNRVGGRGIAPPASHTTGHAVCASEADLNVGESPTRRIGLFATEHELNSAAVRRGWKLREWNRRAVTKSEPHLMSLEKVRPGAKPSPSAWGEGRREQARKQSAPAPNSGGVRVDSASGSKVRVSWENSGNGRLRACFVNGIFYFNVIVQGKWVL
jgi:hypothetical protein